MSDKNKSFEKILDSIPRSEYGTVYDMTKVEILQAMQQAHDLAKPSVRAQELIEKYEAEKAALKLELFPYSKYGIAYCSDFLSDLRTLKESEVAETKWISVESPPTDTNWYRVLVDGKHHVLPATYSKSDGDWYFYADSCPCSNVSHYQPFEDLPVPPEAINTLNK